MDLEFPVMKWIMIVTKRQGSITPDNHQPTTTYQFYSNYIHLSSLQVQAAMIYVMMIRPCWTRKLLSTPYHSGFWSVMNDAGCYHNSTRCRTILRKTNMQAKSNSGRGDPDSQIIKNHGQWQCVVSSKQIKGYCLLCCVILRAVLWSRAKSTLLVAQLESQEQQGGVAFCPVSRFGDPLCSRQGAEL